MIKYTKKNASKDIEKVQEHLSTIMNSEFYSVQDIRYLLNNVNIQLYNVKRGLIKGYNS
jgi:hypothetical protein